MMKKSNPPKNTDQNFDGIANKFDNNIYGTTKGRLRHQLLKHQLLKWLPENKTLSVFDIGGGTGEMSRVMLERGYKVMLNDISAESLELAKQKLSSFSHVDYIKGDLVNQQTVESHVQQADCVVCHAVLEWTIDPNMVIERLVAMLKPDGLLSLSFFNRDAAIFSNALYGNFEYIDRGLNVRNQVRLNPKNPQSPKDVIGWLESAGLRVEESAGVRCFHDYMRDRDHQVEKYDQLLALEKSLATQEPYKWFGRYFHIIARHVNNR